MCHRLLFVMDLFCSLCCLPFCRLSCCRRPKSEFLRGVRDIKDCLGCALDSVEKRRLPNVPGRTNTNRKYYTDKRTRRLTAVADLAKTNPCACPSVRRMARMDPQRAAKPKSTARNHQSHATPKSAHKHKDGQQVESPKTIDAPTDSHNGVVEARDNNHSSTAASKPATKKVGKGGCSRKYPWRTRWKRRMCRGTA